MRHWWYHSIGHYIHDQRDRSQQIVLFCVRSITRQASLVWVAAQNMLCCRKDDKLIRAVHELCLRAAPFGC